MAPDAVKPKERFVLIDGLRGIAALGVMFFHLCNSELRGTLQSTFPAPIIWLFGQAAHGVQIFFVISGFVIAWSLRAVTVTGAGAGNFILRRQIRLDPAYWACIAATLLHAVVMGTARAQFGGSFPSPPHIAENMFYVQHLLSGPDIVVVSWTLCLEVQFYLIYILILLLVQRGARRLRRAEGGQGTLLMAIMAPLMAISLWRHARETQDSPWFINTWYLFGMGVLACWAMERRIRALPVIAAVGLLFAAAMYAGDVRMICGCATTLVILAAARFGGLTTWLANPLMQYFGRISYSLYLVHWEVGHDALRMGLRLLGNSSAGGVASFFLAAAACIGAAEVLHRLVERPSMNLAATLKRKPVVETGEPV